MSYLDYIEPGLSAAQNIQHICFEDNGPLRFEFDKLFRSLFDNEDAYIEIIRLLARNRAGYTRSEIAAKAKHSSNGGRLSNRLQDLCEAGFVEAYIPWGKTKGEYYKCIDEFSLFYLHWIKQKRKKFIEDYWVSQMGTPAYHTWSGYAFENICMKHVASIVKALNIKASGTIDSWRFIPRKKQNLGAQIDLLIDRNDNAITLCEIKFTDKIFTINKEYSNKLLRRKEIFIEKTATNKQVFIAIIASNGLKTNQYSRDLISGVVTMKELFA